MAMADDRWRGRGTWKAIRGSSLGFYGAGVSVVALALPFSCGGRSRAVTVVASGGRRVVRGVAACEVG